jgi:hypothetical protein
VALLGGDVVELSERDRPRNEPWSGLNTVELKNLKKCLSREVEFVVKGERARVVLEPGAPTPSPFWIRPTVMGSPLVLASSDLSHVKVTRTNPATGEKAEIVLDCTGSAPAPEVWLQNGDVIEIPEKP